MNWEPSELKKINSWLTQMENILNHLIQEEFNSEIPNGRTRHKETLAVKFILQEQNEKSLKIESLLKIKKTTFITKVIVLSGGEPTKVKTLGITKAIIDARLPRAVLDVKDSLNPLDRLIFDQLLFRFQLQ